MSRENGWSVAVEYRRVVFETADLGLFIVASLALLLAPGPAVLYILARSLDQGRSAGLISVLGVALGSMVHVTAAALGLSAILVSSVTAFRIVKYAGAAYLIYLGVRRLLGGDSSGTAQPPAASRKRVFVQGVVVNVLNPKTALFFFAFLPQFVSPGSDSPALQIFLLGLLFVTLGLVSDGAYAMLAGSFSTAMRRRAWVGRLQRYVGGSTLVGLGALAALGRENSG